jgi:hypothetical protein
MPDVDCIREQLSLYPGSKLGFVIYRLAYSDDAQWARFMSHLNTRIRLDLEEEGNGDLFSHIDWDLQEDPELDSALYETVREWVDASYLEWILRETLWMAWIMLMLQALRNVHF